jgi:hypothetical protein
VNFPKVEITLSSEIASRGTTISIDGVKLNGVTGFDVHASVTDATKVAVTFFAGSLKIQGEAREVVTRNAGHNLPDCDPQILETGKSPKEKPAKKWWQL